MNPLSLDLTGAIAALEAREISSVELTDLALTALEEAQPRLNCVIRLDKEPARAAAAAADKTRGAGKAGPLTGLPLAHKDMYYQAGLVSTCGSKINREYRPTTTSTALARLGAAGALSIGTLNMAEFAFGPTGHNYHFGHCRNPWNQDYITGGSSSGSGSAVGARVIHAALGSDTGGSIRVPAAACGTAGIKPTWGRVSRAGAMPLSRSLDTVGPLARTVRDCALLLGIIAGHDPADPTSSRHPVPDYLADLEAGASGLKIGIPKGYFDQGLDDEVAADLADSARRFERLGAKLVTVPMPDLDVINQLCNVVVAVEATTTHRNWLRDRPQDYSDQVRNRLENGLFYPATAYHQALDVRAVQLRGFTEAVFGACDVLLAPTLARHTPTLAETDATGGPALAGLLAWVTRFTRPVNYLGLPSLSVPTRLSTRGLPMGFQLVGRSFDEALLFRAGRAFEREICFHDQAPPHA